MTCQQCGGTAVSLEHWVSSGVGLWVCEECASPLLEADANASLDVDGDAYRDDRNWFHDSEL